jgi:SAM-dependent methyltransferase
MQLDDIVPWGRSYAEYRAMFALTEEDLGGRILGVGDGPAGFNAEAHARGQDVTSVDPIYAFTAETIAGRIRTVRPQIEAGLRANPSRYVWDRFRDVEALIAHRLDTMERFLEDYPGPGMSPRYRAARLPRLPYEDGAFDLVLVSHLLFTYSDHLGTEAHVECAKELLRVGREVRIFPILTLDGALSPHLDAVTAHARAAGWNADILPVDYIFQVGGNRMLRLWRSTD